MSKECRLLENRLWFSYLLGNRNIHVKNLKYLREKSISIKMGSDHYGKYQGKLLLCYSVRRIKTTHVLSPAVMLSNKVILK